MFVPRTALAVAASDREGRIKLLTATGFTPDQHLYTTIDHVLYPTITNFKTLQAYLHSNRPFPTIQTTIDYTIMNAIIFKPPPYYSTRSTLP